MPKIVEILQANFIGIAECVPKETVADFFFIHDWKNLEKIDLTTLIGSADGIYKRTAEVVFKWIAGNNPERICRWNIDWQI